MTGVSAFLETRNAGILLHPTSLPDGPDNGTLGPDAYRFVDFLHEAGMAAWQILPHGPTHEDLSPYLCMSTHAGNPDWISTTLLVDAGWLKPEEANDPAHTRDPHKRDECLRKASQGFADVASTEDRRSYHAFLNAHRDWLEDFVLYLALRKENGEQSWVKWPPPVRERKTDAMEQARIRLADTIELYRFEQFLFFRQWHTLRQYANQRGIAVIGDLPIYVAYDSADVWACREQFDLQANGLPRSVAGVPPDYFSPTGQRWGNPHYHWKHMQDDGFRWWRQRLRTSLELFDFIRIDHFRGFESCWAIPYEAETAEQGTWVKSPGKQLFRALLDEFGELPLIAEDLGIITPAVEALRHKFGIPGMKVLQFAFDGGTDNPYLLHNHERQTVVYTGTHDNNTTKGWYDALPAADKERVRDYLFLTQEAMPWPMVRAALASVANTAILPMQDILGLGADARMNIPGTTDGNWRWRFEWTQVEAGLVARLHQMLELYHRLPQPAAAHT